MNTPEGLQNAQLDNHEPDYKAATMYWSERAFAAAEAHAAALEELAIIKERLNTPIPWPEAISLSERKAAEALEELAAVKAERETFYMNYRMQCDAGQKAAEIRAEKAESALAQAERRGMERAAESLHMTNGEILLMAGELTASELRAVKAVMESKRESILAAAGAR